MYRSTEVRWFLQGELPGDVCEWFEAGVQVRKEPERTDEYLVLPGCATTSIKFRDGRLEVKARTEPPVPVTYPHGNSGLGDAWVKWSSTSVGADSLRQMMVRPEDEWILVSKNRRLRLVSLEDGAPVEVGADHGWLSRGCQVELTAVRVWSPPQDQSRAASWWSLSFEAFGDAENTFDSLDLVARKLLSEPPPITLDQEASLSYPAWLSRLTCSPSH